MSQKEVVDNVKLLESIEEIMQPVRLEYVQLKRSLDAIQMKYDNILYEHEEDLDQTELTVENQVKAFLKSHLNFHFTLNKARGFGTVATDELLCLKNAGTFTSNE